MGTDLIPTKRKKAKDPLEEQMLRNLGKIYVNDKRKKVRGNK